MYEVKYRAWIKDEKKIVPVNSIHLNNGTIMVSNKWGNGSVEDGDFILMQYTGLKDKHDQEIYEGDFIRCKSAAQSPYDRSDPNLRVVKRDPKTHQLGLFGSVKDDYQASGFGLSETTYKRWEVVGNIYEGI